MPDTIHDVMQADVRRIYGKVEIIYTDRNNDTSIVYGASDTGRLLDILQLGDYVETTPYKWFSLHDNKLDGSYNPLPANHEVSVGWWNNTNLSDGSGVFSTPPYVQISFSTRTLKHIYLASDPTQGVYLVDFDIKAYDSSNNLISTVPIRGNASYVFEQDITPINNVAKAVFSILKINKPNFTARMSELGVPTKEVYVDDDLLSVDLLEEVGYSTGSLPIGNVSANEIDISLLNENRKFDLDNTSSDLYGLIKRNRRVNVYLGTMLNGTLAWYPMGVFWTSSWDIPRNALAANLTARDRLEAMRLTDFFNHTIFVNKTLYWLFEYVLQDAGLTATEYSLDSALLAVTIPYAWFDRASHREALQRLAGCGLVQVYCDKLGVIHVNKDFDNGAPAVTTFSDNTNIYNDNYPLAVSEQVNYIAVSAVPQVLNASAQILAYTGSISVPGGGVTTSTFNFNDSPAMNVAAPVIVAESGVSVQSYAAYSWGIVITFQNTAGTAKNVTSVTVNGQVLGKSDARVFVASDADMMKEDGKIQQTLEHDFIQDFTYAQSLADDILLSFKQSRYDVTLDNRGDIGVALGDKITVAVDGNTRDYFVYRQKIRWDGSLQVTTEGKLPQGG